MAVLVLAPVRVRVPAPILVRLGGWVEKAMLAVPVAAKMPSNSPD